MREDHLAAAIDALLDDVVGPGREVGVQCVAVAVMRNRFTADFTTIKRIDRLIEDELS